MTTAPSVESPDTDLEVYKLAVEMADRISGRRAIANSFYLALHSALVSGILISISNGGPCSALHGILLACAILPGLALALLWEPARKRGVGGGWGSLSRGRGPAGIGD